jgi:hypothetical protein
VQLAPGVTLPDGSYRFTLIAAGVADNGGRSLGHDVVVNFEIGAGAQIQAMAHVVEQGSSNSAAAQVDVAAPTDSASTGTDASSTSQPGTVVPAMIAEEASVSMSHPSAGADWTRLPTFGSANSLGLLAKVFTSVADGVSARGPIAWSSLAVPGSGLATLPDELELKPLRAFVFIRFPQ